MKLWLGNDHLSPPSKLSLFCEHQPEHSKKTDLLASFSTEFDELILSVKLFLNVYNWLGILHMYILHVCVLVRSTTTTVAFYPAFAPDNNNKQQQCQPLFFQSLNHTIIYFYFKEMKFVTPCMFYLKATQQSRLSFFSCRHPWARASIKCSTPIENHVWPE